MKKPKYVSLEPDAFLSDEDFQIMTGEERGVYWTIILYLYRNNGKLKYEETKLRKLCNVNGEFGFQSVLSKFQVRRGYIRHKRVSREIKKAQALMDRGVKAAKARWHKQCTSNAQATAKQCQVKLSKGKVSKGKERVFKPPTLQEVIGYVKEKGYQVDVKKFFEYYTESNWHDRDGKPVRNWKQKIIAVWNKPGGQKKCRISNCNALGVYTSTDDTGQICWWCEKHKQGWRPALPKELTENVLKVVDVKDQRSLSDKQNEQKNKLGKP